MPKPKLSVVGENEAKRVHAVIALDACRAPQSTKAGILERFDAMAAVVERGNVYVTPLDPPPASPLVAHLPRSTVELSARAEELRRELYPLSSAASPTAAVASWWNNHSASLEDLTVPERAELWRVAVWASRVGTAVDNAHADVRLRRAIRIAKEGV